MPTGLLTTNTKSEDIYIYVYFNNDRGVIESD